MKTLKQYIGKLPQTLTLDANSSPILVTDEIQTSNITIKKDTNVTIVAILNKGWEELCKLNFNFEGEDSTLTFIAFIIAKDTEKFPFETISNHETERTNGYYYIRAAQFDKSIVDYRGVLVIKPGAQITDSYLAHHTLMLSKNAKTYTVPSLEIEADDVKAGHAATMGKVDEELLFYLQTRGVNKSEAEEMLIQSFMETDLEKIPDEEIRKILAEEIEKSLS